MSVPERQKDIRKHYNLDPHLPTEELLRRIAEEGCTGEDTGAYATAATCKHG